jgi:hypothetical protein
LGAPEINFSLQKLTKRLQNPKILDFRYFLASAIGFAAAPWAIATGRYQYRLDKIAVRLAGYYR